MLSRALFKLCAQLRRIYIIDSRSSATKTREQFIPFEFRGFKTEPAENTLMPRAYCDL